MTENPVRRIRRKGPLTPEQVARDEEIRRQVREEFPPVAPPALGEPLSQTLKKAIRESEMTEYQIAKRAGISQIMISRFLSGERSIRLATADKLAGVLGLKLVPA